MPELDNDYESPRWSHELTDCSMPMSFDTYSQCSYACQYCFSNFQREVGVAAGNFRHRLRSVDAARVKRIFLDPNSSQFGPYVQQRKAMQWGGLSDPFDEFERQHGVSLELLRFFREIAYPVSLCTKGVWWADDARYVDCFRGAPNFHLKVSIITPNDATARKVEPGCPSSTERLALIAKASQFVAGGVALRLRPFIIGITDKEQGHVRLIEQAAAAGAEAVSTEFMCLELRSPKGRAQRYPRISAAAGFDVVAFYKRYSVGSGYQRLSREIKRRYVDEMEAAARRVGLRFYVSDADFKERCDGVSCCGLRADWNCARGQFTQALLLARQTGSARWSDIAADAISILGQVSFTNAENYNTGNSEKRAAFHGRTMLDALHYWWNHPDDGQSPYHIFRGVLRPVGLDEAGDVIYEYDAARL